MQINNTIDCLKPKRISTFKGENPESSGRKVRYKHYEQMDEDTLSLHSIKKAHNDVQKSAKMQLFKAIPHVTTALIGTSIAITQPGKLAAKAGAGLGFLALAQLISSGEKLVRNIDFKKDENEFDKNENQQMPKSLKAARNVALAVGVVGACVGLAKSKSVKKVGKFISNEVKLLSDEINNSRIGQRFNEFFDGFSKKHQKGLNIFGVLAPMATIVGSTALELKLSDSLSKDIKEKASENYARGKMAQLKAREHFDSIDAQEI